MQTLKQEKTAEKAWKVIKPPDILHHIHMQKVRLIEITSFSILFVFAALIKFLRDQINDTKLKQKRTDYSVLLCVKEYTTLTSRI